MESAAASYNYKILSKSLENTGAVSIPNQALATFYDASAYSVVLNLLGTKQKDIHVEIDDRRNEIGIYAGKQSDTSKSISFWVFAVPTDGLLNHTRVKYKSGGLEVTVPRRLSSTA